MAILAGLFVFLTCVVIIVAWPFIDSDSKVSVKNIKNVIETIEKEDCNE
jgi:hypothetical protein